MKAIAIHALVVGKADKARTVEPGTEFDTEKAGLADREVAQLEASGALKRVLAPAAAEQDPA